MYDEENKKLSENRDMENEKGEDELQKKHKVDRMKKVADHPNAVFQLRD